MSNSIILVIVILAITWIVVYFYYHHKNQKKEDSVSSANMPEQKIKNRNKKVRFSDDIKYNTYKKIDVDDVLLSQKYEDYFEPNEINSLSRTNRTNRPNRTNRLNRQNRLNRPNRPNKLGNLNQPNLVRENGRANRLQKPSASGSLLPLPSNLDQSTPGDRWDANFGVPLYTKDEQKKFVEKMQRNMNNYALSLGEFVQYQTDKDTIIKTDTTIDPFKPQPAQRSTLQGRTIKEIYDEQVAGPRAIPKRIKQKTPTSIIYENESEMNGGIIKGTNLHGYDGIKDGFKSASFGDEFNVDQFV